MPRLRPASRLLLALAVGLTGLAAHQAAAPVTATAATSPVVPPVDTDDRAAVDAHYQAYGTAPAPAIGWTGSIGGCNAGTVADEYQTAVLRRINYYRSLAGISSATTLAPGRVGVAQAAALVMSASGALSHSPDASWACYSPDGATGAGGSNIALGVTGPDAIDLYMEDPGAGNAAVGHRSWLLQPAATTFASGNVPASAGKPAASAVYVLDVNPYAAWPAVRDPAGIVAWPPRGYVPRPDAPNDRWSVFDDSTNFTGATLTVSVGGVAQPVVVETAISGRLVWKLVNPLPTSGDVAVRVQISGVVSGSAPVAYDYTTILFTPGSAGGGSGGGGTQPTGNGDYRPVVPERLLDTRPSGPQTGYSGAKPTGGQTIELQVTGAGATRVPADAAAVALNVTVTEPDAAGYVTVWPCGSPRPTASNLNVDAGQTLPNLVMARVGAGGRVCLFTQSPAHLIADVNGWFPAATTFRPVSPERLLDTRAGGPQVGYTGAKPAAGQVIELPVTGIGRTAVPGSAVAVVLNVTVTEPDAATYVTVWPCGQARPTASNLNANPGQTVANLVVARVGAGGRVCLYTMGSAHVVADVNGWFPTGTGYVPASPQRLLDTRPATVVGGVPGRVLAGSTRQLVVAGGGTQPAGRAVVLNVTVTDPATAGYVTVWPCGSPKPMASNLNVSPGLVAANLAVVAVDATGTVCFFASTTVDLIVDRNGDF